ncbi:hypothetical protein GCM10009547_21560 [Sporichthya brevicatena]|uniref:Uncharacterized protein n=1 Tax=Sporichthya brevicatena TaxID=171442 RepID=A0ABN1GT64_9ACTN
MNSLSAPVAAPLWSVRAHLVHGVLTALGAVLFLAGTAVVANEKVYADQEPGLAVATVGVVLGGAAGLLLLVHGRRRVAVRRDQSLSPIPAAPGVTGATSRTRPARTRSADPAGFVAGEGLVHFHRRDCSMAEGRRWPVTDRAGHERAGRRPCGVCRP